MAVRWLVLLLTGCSLTLSGPDPNRPRTKPPVCDTSKSLVALDGVMAAAMGIAGVAAASSNNGSAAVAPALLAAAFIGSAIHGNNAVNDCHREMQNYDEMIAAQEAMPPATPTAQLGPRPPVGPPPMSPPAAPVAAPPAAPLAAPLTTPPAAPLAPPPAPAAQPPAEAPQPEQPEPPSASAPAPAPASAPGPVTRPSRPAPQGDRWSAFWREVP